MSTYFKAVRPNGRDWHTNSVQWAPPEGHEGEWIVRHPTATTVGSEADEYLSVSTVATDCTGFQWPARLLTVEAVDPSEPVPVSSDLLPNKRSGVEFRVVGERPAHELFGPQGEQFVALIERARALSGGELDRLAAAARGTVWGAARHAAQRTARGTVWGAARHEAWFVAEHAAWAATQDAAECADCDAALVAAQAAALALVSRDLIGRHGFTQEHYDLLTNPWRAAIGAIHPDDPEVPS